MRRFLEEDIMLLQQVGGMILSGGYYINY